MLKHPDLTEGRIEQFVRHFLEPRVLGDSAPLRVEFCEEACCTQQQAAAAEWAGVEPGFRWGPAFRTVWFRVAGTVPRSWAGTEVVAELPLGGERTVWKNNSPVAGVDEPHSTYAITQSARGGDRVELYVQAYGGDPDVSVHLRAKPRRATPFEVGEARLRVFDADLWQFYLDCKFAHALMKSLPKGDVARSHLLVGLNEAINVFDPDRRESLSAASKLVKDATSPRRVDRYHCLTPVGHAHLDTAWLWPLDITMKKMAHTAATQLALMDEYPEYVFVHSQPAQYEWLEKQYPKLFERVKDKIAEGQWEALGSMWVEADTNVPSGESLVRQLLYGKRYFARKLNIETKDLWLPDVFGYSAALPQILAKSGVEYFMTQKISWNQFNRFPHNTFWWQGIDGTRIWSHFPPADTYTASCAPEQLQKHLLEHREHARSDHGLYVFGFGDGGGGPTAEMIEFLRRAARAPGMPQIEWRTAAEFFEEAKAKSRDLPTWVGELYFELHRGTYTTQANNKKQNRACEFLLRDVEFLYSLTPESRAGYPQSEIERLWKLVLFNQFHDIIPGSSIREVYEDSDRDYAEVATVASKLIRTALISHSNVLASSRCDRPYALFTNADGVTECRIDQPKGALFQSLECDGIRHPVQAIDEFGDKFLIFSTPEPAMHSVAIADFRTEPCPPAHTLRTKSRRLESEQWHVRFDANGNITSVASVEDDTEFIAPGSLANMFQIFDDRPGFWDAWDIDAYALETGKDLVHSERFEVVEKGPVRVAAEIEKRVGKSRILQRISLGPTPGIRFDTLIDWQEEDKLLKVAFPVNISSARATYEIQFGSVERPTHRNTSWDIARFEVCGHKWIDLSEGDQGVALLNDGKYGHDVHENVMRITLLRSPKAPDPLADMGCHRFTYVMLPHYGAHNWAGVVQAGYALNSPLRYAPIGRHAGTGIATGRFVTCDDRNLVVDTVKKAEDSAHLIVRLYECHGARGKSLLACSADVRSAYLCDLMENEVAELPLTPDGINLDYRPFELITVKLKVS
jgi:alpha-mannosidase